MKKSVMECIDREKIIVILRGIEEEHLIPLCEAMYEGGIRLLELTYSSDGSRDEKTKNDIAKLSEHFRGRMHIGAGTVLTERQVEYTKEAGGEFIISPNVNPEIIKRTNELSMVSIPGALTPTEIASADAAGADYVKLFPISTFGTEYLKAVKAPLSHIKFLAVGGINEINASEYLKAGAVGIGVGSNIADKNLIKASNFEAIKALSEKYVLAVK